MNLKNYIKDVPDFPKKGIIFKDVTPLINDGEAFSFSIEKIASFAKEVNANVVVAPEARGFIFACPVATTLKIGFVPIRKPGKLPRESIDAAYDLEYGQNVLAMHKDAIKKGDKVIIIDDLLATGGTIGAGIELVEKLGGIVVGIACVIELKELCGRKKLENYNVFTLLEE